MLAVTPNGATVPVPATQQMVAVYTDTNGISSDVTTLATWSSSSTGTATVSTTGVVTGVAGGSANITAQYAGETSNSAQVSVAASTQTLPSFCCVADIHAGNATEDPAAPSVAIGLVGAAYVGQSFEVMWWASATAQIEVTGSDGYDSGKFSALPSAGLLTIPAQSAAGTYSLTITGYDANGTELMNAGTAVTETTQISIQSAATGFGTGGFGNNPFGS